MNHLTSINVCVKYLSKWCVVLLSCCENPSRIHVCMVSTPLYTIMLLFSSIIIIIIIINVHVYFIYLKVLYTFMCPVLHRLHAAPPPRPSLLFSGCPSKWSPPPHPLLPRRMPLCHMFLARGYIAGEKVTPPASDYHANVCLLNTCDVSPSSGAGRVVIQMEERRSCAVSVSPCCEP